MRDISKLPKWAQDEITMLRGRVAHYERTEAAIEAGTTNTMILPALYPVAAEPIYLPDATTIRFLLPEGWIDCSVYKDAVRVYSHGSESFIVLPQASNSIHMRFIPRDAS